MAPISSSVRSTGNSNSNSNGNGKSVASAVIPESHVSSVDRPSAYFGHDSKEVTRLIIQALDDLGYPEVSNALIDKSGYNIETGQVKEFRLAISNGQWNVAEDLLKHLELDSTGKNSHETILLHTTFLIRRQQYLEALENGDSADALGILQHQLAPLGIHKKELHALSELALVSSPAELKSAINWDGIKSRYVLLRGLEEFLSPSIMIAPHRLATLLDKALEYQVSNANYWVTQDRSIFSLYRDYTDKRERFPIHCKHVLSKHTDEVWHVSFSHSGNKLVSASKDSTIIIWDAVTFNQDSCQIIKAHDKGVLAVEWSPDDKYLLSSSTDHQVKLWDASTGDLVCTFSEHTDVVGSVGWLPDSKHFVTGSPDKRLIMWDITGRNIFQWESNRVMNLAISPDGKKMVVLCHDSVINLYDLETRELESCVSMDRVLSCVSISKDSRYALINVAKDEVFLWDLQTIRITRKYVGQKQTEFMIRSCFGGVLENFILSGSEDANIYVWNRHTTELVEVLSGHEGTVNCVKWDPKGRPLFASAGDDKTIRIWEPLTGSS